MAGTRCTNNSLWTGDATRGVVKIQETRLRPRNQVLNTLSYNEQSDSSEDDMDTYSDEDFISESQTEADDMMEVDEPKQSTTVIANG